MMIRGSVNALQSMRLASIVALLAAGCAIVPLGPSSQPVVLSSGIKVDVISILRDASVSHILEDSVLRGREAVVVNYYTRLQDLDSRAASDEAQQLVEVGRDLAQQSNDSLIVVRQTATIGPQWSPFVRGRIYFYSPLKRTYLFGSAEDRWERVFP
jgi:hypothetical protein